MNYVFGFLVKVKCKVVRVYSGFIIFGNKVLPIIKNIKINFLNR